MSPCAHVTARSFAQGGDAAINSKLIQAERPLAVCQCVSIELSIGLLANTTPLSFLRMPVETGWAS